ncbi:MAG: hypothetical protein KJ722_04765, partial [Candidatus Omnitrophica bacterium]|nr:hypothetical protein [Candidatus Omnitrophota bacterium]
MARKILSLVLSFGLLFQQVSFAQVALELNLANYLSRFGSNIVQDKFRPIHLRYFSYDSLNNSFKLLVDKGDELSRGIEGKGIGKGEEIPEEALKDKTQTLLNYFLIGVTLPDSMFWVNLRPDSEDQIIDQYLEKTDVGKIMLETDLQLKKDTALFTSPNTPEGKEYWTKLYQKAEELYGYESVNIPTLTRPWIVPGEIILREAEDSAYIYKATLKVMLESDYLANSTNPVIANNSVYQFKDERSKALNEYSSGLIRELIIPKLTKEVNSSRRYANFRQVYYSLILSRWFKQRFKGLSPSRVSESTLKGAVPAFTALIETKNLTNLISKDAWSKTDYFKLYQKSFAEGEYNVKEPVYTPTGQMIRSYFSGGINMGREAGSPINNPNSFIGRPINPNIFNTGIVADGDSLRGIKISASPITTKGMPDYRREYDLMEAHNRIERQARSGPYIDLLKGVVLNGKGILSDTASRSLLYSATDSVNRVLRENLIRHPRSSYYDEKRLLSEIADGRYYLIKDFGKEESLNGLAEIAAQRLATLMVLKKNQLLSILYSDNPRVIILSNVLKEKGYTVKSPGEEDSTTGSFTLLVNFATTLDKAGNLLNCESKFKLLANAAIMVLPDISTPTGMLTAIRIFSRARAFFDAASSLPVTAAGSAVTSLVSAIVTETKDADNYLTTLQAEVKKENPNINIILTMERNLEVLYKNGVFPSQSLFNDLKELIERLNSSNDLVAIDAAITLRFYLNEETLEILNIKIDELNKEKEKRYRLIGKVVDARDKIKKHLDSEKSKSAAGSPIISDLAKAVEQEQSLLEEDVNEQVLKFTVVTDENGKPLHPISPEDSVMVGHVRGDRAGYFARGLWSRGFKKLLGYIKFSNDYQGKSVLSDEVIAKVPNTFFEILSNKMYKVLKISENEKKDHVGNNADGKKTDGPYPGEKRINIEMQKSKKAYADTPQMKTKECTDEVLRGLDDDTIDFILVNLLGSDMM